MREKQDFALDVGAGVEEEAAGGELRVDGDLVERRDVLLVAGGGGVGAGVEKGADGGGVAATKIPCRHRRLSAWWRPA